jgi:stage V sporulation protein B
MKKITPKTGRMLSSPLIVGTVFLTASGILSRILGFFYKIFLSRTIGAEALGLYQLVFPIVSLMFAISSAGFQTAVSRYVADAVGSSAGRADGEKKAKSYLAAALFYTTLFSLLCGLILYFFSERIAIYVLGDSRCARLLTILAYAMLPSGIHSCINGYYYGKKKALVPSVCQLAEQLARVGGVYLLYRIVTEQGKPLTAVHASWGLVIGEVCGLLVCVSSLAFASGKPEKSAQSGRRFHLPGTQDAQSRSSARLNRTASDRSDAQNRSSARLQTPSDFSQALARIGLMAIPLTANQALLHLCSSAENILIPLRLQQYGCTSAEALEIYGVLSGMAISVVFFPAVLTNSLSVLLLPSISQAKAEHKEKTVRRAVSLCIYGGLALGFVFTFLFLITGDYIGNVIFGNALAGELIKRLCWICPLMYVYSLLSGVLHGLGAAKQVFFINLLSSGIRIGMLCLLVPLYGIYAILWGMLLSQLFSAVSAICMIQGSKAK